MRLHVELSQEVLDAASISKSETVRSIEANLLSFQELAQTYDDDYGWKRFDSDNLRKSAETLERRDVEALYWNLLAREVEAYCVMLGWRTGELLEDACLALNGQRIGPAAILGRSLLELGASSLVSANDLNKSVEEVLTGQPSALLSPAKTEELIDRLNHGTRLGHLREQGFPEQKNILTMLEKISKEPNAEMVKPAYEALCEVAHPNVLGNARFWGQTSKREADGSEILNISRHCTTGVAVEIIEKSLWAISWSAVAVHNAVITCQGTVKQILNHFPMSAPNK